MTCQRELGNEKTGKLLIQWEKPWDALSLIPKGVNGVSRCGFDGLVAYCAQCNDKNKSRRHDKGPYPDVSPIGKILQPFIHCKLGNKPGDNEKQKPYGREKIDVFDVIVGNDFKIDMREQMNFCLRPEFKKWVVEKVM